MQTLRKKIKYLQLLLLIGILPHLMKKLNELNYSKPSLLPANGKELFWFFPSLMLANVAALQLVLQLQLVMENFAWPS